MARNGTTPLSTATESPPVPNGISPGLNATTDLTNVSVAELPFYMNFRDEPWVIPLVALSLFNIASILIFEIYVLYKSCGGRRHLFLGQILLFGLFLCSALGLVYVPQPHWLLCGITRAGIGIAYAIVFGALLVKCVFLLKLHDGVYFNASFQALLLFFLVAVEVAIVTQWLVYQPPDITSATFLGKTTIVCEKTPLERIQYLCYVMFLLFLVIIASIRSRSLRENNKEAVYIGFSIAISLVLWVAWIAVLIIFERRYEVPAEALGLACTALPIFLLMFIPKALQLGAPRVTGSTAGSHSIIHTPSFLHLQPHAVLPSSAQGTLVKQSHVNADYCRDYPSKFWRYDYPSFHQMEPSPIAHSDMHAIKKCNGSFNHSHLY